MGMPIRLARPPALPSERLMPSTIIFTRPSERPRKETMGAVLMRVLVPRPLRM